MSQASISALLIKDGSYKNDYFNIIADKIYCAALTYDELTQLFYPEYKTRCSDFMEIWKCYEHGKMEKEH